MPISCTTFFGGIMPISCTVFTVVNCRFPAPFSLWFYADFLHGFYDGLMPISRTGFAVV